MGARAREGSMKDTNVIELAQIYKCPGDPICMGDCPECARRQLRKDRTWALSAALGRCEMTGGMRWRSVFDGAWLSDKYQVFRTTTASSSAYGYSAWTIRPLVKIGDADTVEGAKGLCAEHAKNSRNDAAIRRTTIVDQDTALSRDDT